MTIVAIVFLIFSITISVTCLYIIGFLPIFIPDIFSAEVMLFTYLSVFSFKFYSSLLGILFPKKIQKRLIGIQYGNLRKKMYSGDIVAFQSKGIPSWFIRTRYSSPYSHVGLVVRIQISESDHRVFILEADDKKGIILVPLSYKMKTYNGKAWYYTLLDQHDSFRDKIFSFSMDQLGKPYDHKAIINITETTLHLAKKSLVDDDSSYICSGLIGYVLKSIGMLPQDKGTKTLGPQEIINLRKWDEEPIAILI